MSPSDMLVLVVEDDAATRTLIRRTLQGAAFRVAEAESGEAALAGFRELRPALVLLDIMLPGMDGFAVCRALRALDEEVAILMLTAKREDTDKIQGLELGADDYMVKPFNPQELQARLKAILRRVERRGGDGDPLEYRGLRVQFRHQKCYKDGREVDLTPREFALLAELMRTPGRAQSREELTARLWGEGHHGSAKSLDVYVRRLRTKIEDDPSAPSLIRTARGYGYVCV